MKYCAWRSNRVNKTYKDSVRYELLTYEDFMKIHNKKKVRMEATTREIVQVKKGVDRFLKVIILGKDTVIQIVDVLESKLLTAGFRCKAVVLN